VFERLGKTLKAPMLCSASKVVAGVRIIMLLTRGTAPTLGLRKALAKLRRIVYFGKHLINLKNLLLTKLTVQYYNILG
jgi:hypothetical protein